eukprot:TRINITY_DN762_c0_g1_i1.p1 TRINITY_DN762_c0_g1~~TRINITY_DN762_c0_g1_i1.p1  ORF type:complete len:1237 (-),score=305.79 TRINITY_DN762_c0_g1_i1:397-4077(-)
MAEREDGELSDEAAPPSLIIDVNESEDEEGQVTPTAPPDAGTWLERLKQEIAQKELAKREKRPASAVGSDKPASTAPLLPLPPPKKKKVRAPPPKKPRHASPPTSQVAAFTDRAIDVDVRLREQRALVIRREQMLINSQLELGNAAHREATIALRGNVLREMLHANQERYDQARRDRMDIDSRARFDGEELRAARQHLAFLQQESDSRQLALQDQEIEQQVTRRLRDDLGLIEQEKLRILGPDADILPPAADLQNRLEQLRSEHDQLRPPDRTPSSSPKTPEEAPVPEPAVAPAAAPAIPAPIDLQTRLEQLRAAALNSMKAREAAAAAAAAAAAPNETPSATPPTAGSTSSVSAAVVRTAPTSLPPARQVITVADTPTLPESQNAPMEMEGVTFSSPIAPMRSVDTTASAAAAVVAEPVEPETDVIILNAPTTAAVAMPKSLFVLQARNGQKVAPQKIFGNLVTYDFIVSTGGQLLELANPLFALLSRRKADTVVVEDTAEVPLAGLSTAQHQSVLQAFRAYRLSPLFTAASKLKLASPTYSHKIQPQLPLCQFELHGRCNDPTCTAQHRRDYMLSGDDLLVDLMSYARNPDESFQHSSEHQVRLALNSIPRQGLGIQEQDVLQHLGKRDIPLQSRLFAVRSGLKPTGADATPVKAATSAATAAEKDESTRYFNRDPTAVEEQLRRNPKDPLTWLELAAMHLEGKAKTNDAYRPVLQVLSRALEANQLSPLLWALYLHLVFDVATPDDKFQLSEIAARLIGSHWFTFQRTMQAAAQVSYTKACLQCRQLLTSLEQLPDSSPTKSHFTLQVLLFEMYVHVSSGRPGSIAAQTWRVEHERLSKMLKPIDYSIASVAAAHVAVFGSIDCKMLKPILVRWNVAPTRDGRDVAIDILSKAVDKLKLANDDFALSCAVANLAMLQDSQAGQQLIKDTLGRVPNSRLLQFALSLLPLLDKALPPFAVERQTAAASLKAAAVQNPSWDSWLDHVAMLVASACSHDDLKQSLEDAVTSMVPVQGSTPAALYELVLGAVSSTTTDRHFGIARSQVSAWLLFALYTGLTRTVNDVRHVFEAAVSSITSAAGLQSLWSEYLQMDIALNTDPRSLTTQFERFLRACPVPVSDPDYEQLIHSSPITVKLLSSDLIRESTLHLMLAANCVHAVREDSRAELLQRFTELWPDHRLRILLCESLQPAAAKAHLEQLRSVLGDDASAWLRLLQPSLTLMLTFL